MIDYYQSLDLLGVPDQNLPVFKEARVNRIKSIEKINSLINIAKRLSPTIPTELVKLDPTHPEWEDKMVYPLINYSAYLKKLGFLALNTAFMAYNWNVIAGNTRLKFLKILYPVSTVLLTGDIFYNYSK